MCDLKEKKMTVTSSEASKKITLNKKAKDNLFVLIMLFIPVVHFIIFWVIVNFNSILLSFQKFDFKTGKHTLGFQNFKAVAEYYKSGIFKDALKNTLLNSGFQIIFLLPWGFFLTYFLYKKIILKGVWRVCLFLPSILPALFLTVAFSYALNPIGPVGKLWEALFGKEIPALLGEKKYAKWTVIAYFFLTNFGGQFILFTGAMSRIPDQIFEAAQIDGAGMGTEIFKIVFPLCWPTFSMLLILNFSSVFISVGPVFLLTGGGADTETIANWIFKEVNDGHSLYIPATLGLICTVIIFPIITIIRWASGKIYADVEF